MDTCSLGMMKAYEAMPPERRLQDWQWHVRVEKPDSGFETET